jgi:U3 small nucleolar ribonucleoprotein component
MTKKSLKEFRAHWRKKLQTLDRLHEAALFEGEEAAADEILAKYFAIDLLVETFESALSKELRRKGSTVESAAGEFLMNMDAFASSLREAYKATEEEPR